MKTFARTHNCCKCQGHHFFNQDYPGAVKRRCVHQVWIIYIMVGLKLNGSLYWAWIQRRQRHSELVTSPFKTKERKGKLKQWITCRWHPDRGRDQTKSSLGLTPFIGTKDWPGVPSYPNFPRPPAPCNETWGTKGKDKATPSQGWTIFMHDVFWIFLFTFLFLFPPEPKKNIKEIWSDNLPEPCRGVKK